MRLVSVLLVVCFVLTSTMAFAGNPPDKKPIEKPRSCTRGDLDCTSATRIDCPYTGAGTTVGGTNNVSIYSCTSWNEGGPEVVYELTLTGPDCYVVTGTISGMTADLDIFFLTACDEGLCQAYGNTAFTSECLVAGTYYIVVDGYGTAEDAFTLDVICDVCECPGDPPPNDTCAGAIEVFDGTVLSASLADANDDYNPGYGGCPGAGSAYGRDVAYVITLAAGEEVVATMSPPTFDAVFYLVTDCYDIAGTCLAGSDACCTGAMEEIVYCSTEGGTYYIIADAYGSGNGGAFDLTVTVNECYIPPPPCCPFPHVCYAVDFNEVDAWMPIDCGGTPVWEWGAQTNPEAPTVACDDVPITNILATQLAGDYLASSGQIAAIGPFQLDPCCYCLEICHWYDIETSYDGGNVKVSGDGGATWTLVHPAAGYPGTTNTYPMCMPSEPAFTGHGLAGLPFVRDCFDLTDFIGQEIVIGLFFGSDSSVQYPGWYVKWVKLGSETASRVESETWGGVKAMYR